MRRGIGALNLAQAGVYGVVAWELAARHALIAGPLAVAALAQLLAGAWLLAGRGPTPARWASAASLVAVAWVVGLHVQVGVHVLRSFSSDGGTQGAQLLALVALALPWLAFFPAWQLARLGIGRGAPSVAALALALPVAQAAWVTAPTRAFPPVDGALAAAWIHARITGAPAAPVPEGAGPVLLVASVVRGGEVTASQALAGDTLGEALAALELRAAPDAAVAVDVAVSERSLSAPWLAPAGLGLVPPGRTALRGGAGITGTIEARGALKSVAVAPELRVPMAPASGHDSAILARSWLATASGVVPLEAGWVAPPPFGPDALRDAAHAGARHLAANQGDDDRFAYVVKGPSGKHGAGYNFPRHAGGAWYLGRVWRRTGDPSVRAAGLRALDWLARHTTLLDDGRAYVIDPTRRDDKAWVGTTSLALLAAIALDARPDLQRAWAAHVASAVDDRGAVRGDFDRSSGTWPRQPLVTYAQGQGLLGLAAARRAGLDVGDALERAAAFVDGPYWPMPAARTFLLDEHWMCLAAVATDDALGQPAGAAVCDAYVELNARIVPVRGRAYGPPAGFGGGLAEAYVARAELARRAGEGGPHMERATAWGEHLLAQAYQPSDAPLVAKPGALVGGFRDSPWDLDVRVDAVQHIGCALLGVEQLLRGEALPGAMP